MKLLVKDVEQAGFDLGEMNSHTVQTVYKLPSYNHAMIDLSCLSVSVGNGCAFCLSQKPVLSDSTKINLICACKSILRFNSIQYCMLLV